MASRLTSPVIVVVDGGKIVVDQGIGMDHFKSAGHRKNPLSLPAGIS